MKPHTTALIACMAMTAACATSRFVQTQWDYPGGSRIRIVDGSSGKVRAEALLPAVIALESTPRGRAYYVEVSTPSLGQVYGTLKVLNITAITELSNVRVELTEEMLRQIARSQVSQIRVTDPAANKVILELDLGNRMPSRMQGLYKKRKITRFASYQ
jgi:hypothetical protein